jgi:universal stress protein A
MKVLIGVDDSQHSTAACAFVERFPWPLDTRFVVLSVVHSPVAAYAGTFEGGWLAPSEEEDRTRSFEDAASDAANILQRVHLCAEAKLAHGDPRTELVDAARRERADLVVVGSHGRTGLLKLFMGSVASHVVKHAPCSVLVVRAKSSMLLVRAKRT